MKSSEFWQKKRVLITGHTGFKGSWLLLWLIELGADVTGISLEPDSTESLFNEIYPKIKGSFKHIISDINEFNTLEDKINIFKPEVVFHLAAQPLVRESYINPVKTWTTNLMGSIFLLEALKSLDNDCSVVMITTDKVYKNNEWIYGYREIDPLGGRDPYSASKASAEIAISSWRDSFCGDLPHQKSNLYIATARSGNVIGGGDWSKDRIFPDVIRSLKSKKIINIRNKKSTRPWQHVLDPIGGYLILAEKLNSKESIYCDAFNFGPNINSNKSVEELVKKILEYWPGEWKELEINSFHEAGMLNLNIDKANNLLGWRPRWSYEESIKKTVEWYRQTFEGEEPFDLCLRDISSYQN